MQLQYTNTYENWERTEKFKRKLPNIRPGLKRCNFI